MYLVPIETRIHSIAIIFSIRVSLEFFRERKRERRRLQGSWSGFGDRKTGARFGWAFLLLLLSFLISILCFCCFDLGVYAIIVNFSIHCWFLRFWVCWHILLISRLYLSCEKIDHFLACFGFWVKDWKVKFETGILEINLVGVVLRKSR